ncbi:hypothetical protein D7X96_21865 [Corallococcus interemptor]|uniref:Dickkopf N-terminal cysteine-rich domain-containing protein n=1 Tax=Corallococcus interemptor TaxID=2316720 RepID=A0A3A8QCF2_9BACT|nr:hypothetical protein [Corallococcus interemptor]RKH66296.1 hypothetical protein D7X96_21865 [Corallococcus interemptor]
MPRRHAFLLFALSAVLALGTGCPDKNPPPAGDAGVEVPDAGTDASVELPDASVPDASVPDASVPDASVACAPPENPGAPWNSRCDSPPAADLCASLVLPEAGPVPSAENWCQESAQRLCAAGVDAGTVEASAEAGCVERERLNCEGRFPRVYRNAGFLTYWPQAASACLTGGLNPSSTVCGCAFVRSSVGGACGRDVDCRAGYCLKDSSDAGVCVACPEKRPVGMACGEPGAAPCDGHGYCSQGCCVPRPNPGEACRIGLIEPKPCDTATSSHCDTAIEDMSGKGTCRAYRTLGQVCGQVPTYPCSSLPPGACNYGACESGLTCTSISPDASVPQQCEPDGVRCDANLKGCGPGQICTSPRGLCIEPASLVEGEACGGPGQCAEGLLCDKPDAGSGTSGVCITASPGECRYDVECPWAQRCTDGHCTEGKALGEACDAPLACAKYLICARGENGGTCAREPRLGERCVFPSADGGFPQWNSPCIEGRCDSTTGLCQ